MPLSALAQAELVVVVGDDEIAERAPVVDLWLKAARRNGAEIFRYGPTGNVATAPGAAAAALHALVEDDPLGERLRASDRAILIWSGSGGGGGSRLAEAAHALGFEEKPGCGAFHLPATANARGVATAWAAAADEDEANPEPIGLLVVSGDEAAADPAVRALAERAERVIAITMFHGLAVGWADLVLPATSYLERDGTTMNLEGRLQRLRRAVIARVPDELAWIAKLAARFDIAVSPHATVVFDELSPAIFGGVDLTVLNSRAGLPGADAVRGPAGRSGGEGAPHASPAGRALPRRAAPAPLPPALLGPLRRSRRGARLPAATCRDRAFRRGRRAPRRREWRHRPRALERHAVELRARVNRKLLEASPGSPKSTPPTCIRSSRW